MKQFYILIITLLFALASYSQNCTLNISYDANGNRIKRELVCAKPLSEQIISEELLTKDTITDELKNNIAEGLFQVYPNPASYKVTVQFDAISLQQSCVIVLVDQLGKEHFRKENADAYTEIALAHLADGMYALVLIRGTQKNTVQVVRVTQ